MENIDFKELKELYLNFNNISDIKALENTKFKKLEILDLCIDKQEYFKILIISKIQSIKKLNINIKENTYNKNDEKVNFKELKELESIIYSNWKILI